jgi:hypothetical protein
MHGFGRLFGRTPEITSSTNRPDPDGLGRIAELIGRIGAVNETRDEAPRLFARDPGR